MKRNALLAALGLSLGAALGPPAAAQELEPRAYSPSPVGLNFALSAYTYSSGGVVFDPSLPVTDVTAHIHSFVVGYGRTFGLFGRQGLVTVGVPYAFGDMEGNVSQVATRITRSGLADLRTKFSVNLYGNPAQTPKEFAQSRHDSILVGMSLTIAAPTGQYDSARLINLGTNRWAFKPELGVSFPWKGFNFDAYAGVVFFTQNPDFYPGGLPRQQDPLGTVQLHVSYTFRPGLWFAVDGTWYGGGASSVNGGPKSSRLSNTRIGGTLSLPLSRNQSVKLAYSRGASVRVGSDFDSVGASWQIRWF